MDIEQVLRSLVGFLDDTPLVGDQAGDWKHLEWLAVFARLELPALRDLGQRVITPL